MDKGKFYLAAKERNCWAWEMPDGRMEMAMLARRIPHVANEKIFAGKVCIYKVRPEGIFSRYTCRI